jgi:aldehyde dehydrogenase (NAD+)
VLARKEIYLDDAWVPAIGTGAIEVENPTTEAVLGTIPACDAADVDRSVQAAPGALPGWRATPSAERAAHLRRLRDELAARVPDLVDTIIDPL